MQDTNSSENYQCPECGMHYSDEATMKSCQAWCSEHKSCNLEITKLSVEAQENPSLFPSMPPHEPN